MGIDVSDLPISVEEFAQRACWGRLRRRVNFWRNVIAQCEKRKTAKQRKAEEKANRDKYLRVLWLEELSEFDFAELKVKEKRVNA